MKRKKTYLELSSTQILDRVDGITNGGNLIAAGPHGSIFIGHVHADSPGLPILPDVEPWTGTVSELS